MNITKSCPICGTTLVVEMVEKLLTGGGNMAMVEVQAGVCKKCGEMVFDAATAERFEDIRARLAKGKVSEFTPTGNAYAVTL